MFDVAVVGVLAGEAVGEFVQVGLTREGGAGGGEGAGEVAVGDGRRDEFGREVAAAARGEASHVKEVFECVGDAAERTVAGRGDAGGEGVGGGWDGPDRGLLRGREGGAAVEDFVSGGERVLPGEGLPKGKSHVGRFGEELWRGNDGLWREACGAGGGRP